MAAAASLALAPSPGDLPDGQPHGRMMGEPSHAADMQAFHYLLEHRAHITRTVTHLPNGIETVTKSANPDVVAQLITHVTAMTKRLADGRPIHSRDPFFAELFRHGKDIDVEIVPLADGVRVVETSRDAFTVKLLQEHARIVDLFLANGMSEMHRDHALPPR
jgi:hypothetical protein